LVINNFSSGLNNGFQYRSLEFIKIIWAQLLLHKIFLIWNWITYVWHIQSAKWLTFFKFEFAVHVVWSAKWSTFSFWILNYFNYFNRKLNFLNEKCFMVKFYQNWKWTDQNKYMRIIKFCSKKSKKFFLIIINKKRLHYILFCMTSPKLCI